VLFVAKHPCLHKCRKKRTPAFNAPCTPPLQAVREHINKRRRTAFNAPCPPPPLDSTPPKTHKQQEGASGARKSDSRTRGSGTGGGWGEGAATQHPTPADLLNKSVAQTFSAAGSAVAPMSRAQVRKNKTCSLTSKRSLFSPCLERRLECVVILECVLSLACVLALFFDCSLVECLDFIGRAAVAPMAHE